MTRGTQDRTSIPRHSSAVSVFLSRRHRPSVRPVLSRPSTSLGLELVSTMRPSYPLVASPLVRMALLTVALSYCWPCRSFLSDQFSTEDRWTTANAERVTDLTVYQ